MFQVTGGNATVKSVLPRVSSLSHRYTVLSLPAVVLSPHMPAGTLSPRMTLTKPQVS